MCASFCINFYYIPEIALKYDGKARINGFDAKRKYLQTKLMHFEYYKITQTAIFEVNNYCANRQIPILFSLSV